MRYKWAELALAVAILICIAVAWFNLRTLPADAKMFPLIILAIMSVGTVFMVIRAVTGASQRVQGEAMQDWRFAMNTQRMLGGFGLFALFLLAVETVGFFTTSAIFVIIGAAFARYRNVWVLIASAAGFCVFIYLVFRLLFDRPLPEEFFLSTRLIESVIEGARHA